MPTISESEFDSPEPVTCFHCQQFDGDVYICGEGFLCTSCFAKMAGIEESLAFDEKALANSELKGKIHTLLKKEPEDV